MLGTGHDEVDELLEHSYQRSLLTRMAFDTFGRLTSLDYRGRNECLLLGAKVALIKGPPRVESWRPSLRSDCHIAVVRDSHVYVTSEG